MYVHWQATENKDLWSCTGCSALLERHFYLPDEVRRSNKLDVGVGKHLGPNLKNGKDILSMFICFEIRKTLTLILLGQLTHAWHSVNMLLHDVALTNLYSWEAVSNFWKIWHPLCQTIHTLCFQGQIGLSRSLNHVEHSSDPRFSDIFFSKRQSQWFFKIVPFPERTQILGNPQVVGFQSPWWLIEGEWNVIPYCLKSVGTQTFLVMFTTNPTERSTSKFFRSMSEIV